MAPPAFQPIVQKTNPPTQPGDARTFHLEGSIVESTYQGYCSQELVKAVGDILPQITSAVPKTLWMVDLGSVTGYDSQARIPGKALMQNFRARGGRQFAFIMSNPRLGFIISAVAFAVGFPIKVFKSRDEALAHFRSMPPA